MKAKPQTAPVEPGEEDIREYAYHLYVQSGCAPGRDLANWTEARACLMAQAAVRSLPRQPRQRQKKPAYTFQSPEAKNLAV
jgi:hypothetical protein